MPDLVERVREVVRGFPNRIVPVSPQGAAIRCGRLANIRYTRPCNPQETITWLSTNCASTTSGPARCTNG
jgi:hypothetical protein